MDNCENIDVDGGRNSIILEEPVFSVLHKGAVGMPKDIQGGCSNTLQLRTAHEELNSKL